MATNVKPTTKNSPRIHVGANKDNGPAERYAARGTDVNASLNNGGYRPDPNTLPADKVMPGGTPARRVSVGDRIREPKSDGITMRGHGAAVKGIKCRGPMA
jgi:hypothetical protein